MKARFFRKLVLTLVLAVFSPAMPLLAQSPGQDAIVIRLQNIGQTLDLMEEWAAASGKPGAVSSAAAMIGGVQWIDPQKAAVVMVTGNAQQPQVYALVPYVGASQAFVQMTQAEVGPWYYLAANPPGPVPQDIRDALIREAQAPGSGQFITLELPAQNFVQNMEPVIAQGLAKMQQLQPGAPAPGQPTAQEMEQLTGGMLDLFKQLKTLTIGLSVSRARVGFSFEGVAVPGSRLAQTMVRPPDAKALLAGYTPRGDITYHTRPFNAAGFMGVFKDVMGAFYNSLGMDLSCLDGPMQELTGEYAASVSFEKDSMVFEGMSCVRDPAAAPLVIERMIFCTENFSKNARGMAQAPGTPKWVRSQESTVSGLNVVGMKTDMSGAQAPPETPAFMKNPMEIRMAALGGFILMASSDAQIANLARKAKVLKPATPKGPTISMDMDLGRFIAMGMEAAGKGAAPSFSGPLRMTMTMDMEKGKGRTEISMNPDEIQGVVRYFAKMSPGGVQTTAYPQPMAMEGAPGQMPYQAPVQAEPQLTPEQIKAQEAAALVEKGNLSAMYGSPKAAIKVYGQALGIDPENPAAHFAMAVSYGELEQFDKAMEHVDRALNAEPDNADFLYGRARLLLMAGREGEAMEEFSLAADLGSQDAKNYLSQVRAGQ